MTADVTSPQEEVTQIVVDDVDLLAILAQPPEQDSTLLIQPEQALDLLFSPTLPDLQSDDEGSELSLTLLDDTTQSRKRSREDYEDEDEDDDPFGFEFLDVVQLEDPAPLAKKPFVNDEELCLDFLNDFESKVEVFEPFTAV